MSKSLIAAITINNYKVDILSIFHYENTIDRFKLIAVVDRYGLYACGNITGNTNVVHVHEEEKEFTLNRVGIERMVIDYCRDPITGRLLGELLIIKTDK